MGIPEFWSKHIRDKKDVDIRTLPADNIYSLAIDLPGIIHGAAQKVWMYGNHEGKSLKEVHEARVKIKAEEKKAEDEGKSNPVRERFYAMVTDKIAELVAAYDPKLLIIAIDGKAPVAKIQEQRKRRYKNRQLNPEEYITFDSVQLSVGTDLMIGLHEYIVKWIDASQRPVRKSEIVKNEEKEFTRAVLPRHVIYSSYLIPGEAEHKIMDLYRSTEFNDLAPRNNRVNIYYNILYGKDADLILLSLISGRENVIIVRESYSNMVNIEGLKKTLDNENISYMDYVIMLSFVGNDFLPKQPAFLKMDTSIEYMFDAYKVLKTEINRAYDNQGLEPRDSIFSDEDGITWNYLAIFLERISDTRTLYNEMVQYHIQQSNKKYSEEMHVYQFEILNSSLKTEGLFKNFNYEKFRKLWYDKALKYEGELPFNIGNGENESDDMIQEGNYTDDDINDMCTLYLVMFSWVYRYYNAMQPNLDLYYPYHYAPLLGDIVKFLKPEGLNEDEQENKISELSEQYNSFSADTEGKSGRYHILNQLLAIVPPTSVGVLPKQIQKFITKYTSDILDIYPSQVLIDKGGSRNESTFNCLVPFVDMNRIIEVTEKDILKIEGNQWDEEEAPTLYENKEKATIKRNNTYYHIRRKLEGDSSESPSRGRGRGGYSRGRGESSRGRGESSRGRGESSRGRGESSRGRGRGYSSRGRGESSRGRGYSSRGRDNKDDKGKEEA